MLKPDKHTEVKYTIVYLSAIIMKEIQQNGIIKYDELKNILVRKIGKNIAENYERSLSFLYLLEKIIYLKDLDSIKLTGK